MAKGYFGGGTGTLADPFLIEDAYDLYAIRFNLTKAYKLVSNINLDVPPFDKLGWLPIPGTFAGALDGNCKKIFNLKINKPDADYVGLFSKISLDFYSYNIAYGTYSCRIANLSIENAKVTGRNYVGILAGYIYARMESSVNINDSSALILEKLHVSGSVTGLNYLGGLAGQFYANSNSGYNWRLMEDCLVDVNITALSDLTYGGLLFGLMSGANSVIPKFNDCITRGSYYFAGGVAANMWSGYPIQDTNVNPKFENTFYDSTLWNGKITTTHTGKTSAKMILKEEFSNLELKKTPAGSSTWIFGYNRVPRLWYLELNNFFVKAGGKYFIYDAVNSKWVQKYDRVPTLVEATRDGMKTLDDIDRIAWNTMKATNASVEIVNIVDKSAGLTLKDNEVVFDRDASKDYLNKQIWRKQIDLANFDHGIFMAEKAVNE